MLALLAAFSVPTKPLLADTILNSGLTTVSTGTNFGTYLVVAQSGSARLEVRSGGHATNVTGVIGELVGSSGTAVVFYGGTWASSDLLDVGDLGTGKLFIPGGSVTSKDGILGFGDSGQGMASVSSGTWGISNELHVGYLGAGVLDVTGGSVTSRVGSLGGYAGSTGTATVSAGTWTNSGDLVVGGGGIGALTMTGGSVKVGGMLTKGTYGTINLNRFGTLQIGVGGTTGVLLGGTGSFDNNGTLVFNRSDASTYSGVISGSGALTKQGAGTLTLSGNNSYAGGTTISDGVLALGSGNAAGTSGTISFGGGTLQYSASNTTDYSSRFSSASSQTYEIDTNGQNVTFASPLTSIGGTLTKSGSGTLTLAGNNTYSGDTRVATGTLALGSVNAVAGSTFDMNASDSSVLAFAVAGIQTYNVGGLKGSRDLAIGGNTLSVGGNGQSTTYSGSLSGTGALAKSGSGTLTLSGSSSYAGGTTISGGVLQVGEGGTTGSIAGNVVNNASLIFNRSDASTYSGVISGNGTVTKQGAGTLTLSGSSFYTGVTTIGDGMLEVGAGGTTGSIAGSVFNSAALVFNRSDASTYSGVISGSGALTKQGAGTLTLSGNNSYTGGTTISDGVLALGSANAAGASGTISFGGGTLQYSASNIPDYSSRFSTAASQAYEIDTNGQNVTLASPLTSIGGTLTKSGSGTLTLSGNNSYTGGTTIGAGAVAIPAGGSISHDSAYLAIGQLSGESGTLNVTGGLVTNTDGYVGYNAGGVGTANVTSGTWANNGNLYVGNSGTGALNVTGGSVTNWVGTLGANVGSVGVVEVSSGLWDNGWNLYIGSDGTGTLNVSGGSVTDATGYIGTNAGSVGTVTVTGGTFATRANLSVGYAGNGTLNVTGGSVSNGDGYLGFLAGSVYSATVTGGTWASIGILRVGHRGTGTLTINGGVVTNTSAILGNALASSVGSVTVSSGTWDSSGNVTVGASGTGTLTVSGGVVSVAGTLSTGTSGTINLNAGGTLQIGVGGTSGVLGVSTLTNNGTLIFSRSDASAYSGIISGTGAVTKQGGGTLTLDGANTYTGLTTISAGTLQIGSGSTTGSIAGNLVNNSSLIFNRSNASTYSGIISGTGTIQNAGMGTTTLTGQTSYTVPLVATAGRLIVGSNASVNGFSTAGSLAAASEATLELKSRGLAYVNGLSTLTGGTIRAANGISLGAGANVMGTGGISGFVSAAYGSRVEADGGKLTVGDSSSYVGFASAGLLYTNANEVEFLDRNLAVLGALTQLGDGSAGGTLRAANGMLLEQGKNLVGRGTVHGNFVNQGDVYGDGSTAGQKIVFAAGSTVSGIGSFENVVFDGTYSPGNSPAITNLTNGQFSSASSLLIELGGKQSGTQYDRVVVSGVLTLLGGTLNVALYNGFVPSYGNSFEILQYGQLSGDFGSVNYPALSGGLSWERTTSATAMTITVVPEPSTYAISVIATAGLAGLMRWRKRRSSESAV